MNNICLLKIWTKKINNFINLFKVLNLSSVQNVNFGLKRMKAVIIWLVDVNFNFVIVVDKIIENNVSVRITIIIVGIIYFNISRDFAIINFEYMIYVLYYSYSILC